MSRDLSIYSFRPPRQHLVISMIVIAAMAVIGLVRGFLGASDAVVERRPSMTSVEAPSGAPAKPADLESVGALMPKVITPPPPPRPAAAAQAPAEPASAPPPAAETPAAAEPPPAEAAPHAPAPAEPAPAPAPAAPAGPTGPLPPY